MSYGFNKDSNPAPVLGGLKLPTPAAREVVPAAPPTREILDAGAQLGFVPREASQETVPNRRPGRRRQEAQDKISVTGPKRVIDRLKAYCDKMGEPSYCTAIERLLDTVEKSGT